MGIIYIKMKLLVFIKQCAYLAKRGAIAKHGVYAIGHIPNAPVVLL